MCSSLKQGVFFDTNERVQKSQNTQVFSGNKIKGVQCSHLEGDISLQSNCSEISDTRLSSNEAFENSSGAVNKPDRVRHQPDKQMWIFLILFKACC